MKKWLLKYTRADQCMNELVTSDKLQERMDAINSNVNAILVQNEYVTEKKKEQK
jgi:hypothetical protein